MGLMDAFKSMRMKDPVDVVAQVVSVGEPPHATHGTAVMNLVVQLPGEEAQSIECTSVPAPVAKWPTPGGQLPVFEGAQVQQGGAAPADGGGADDRVAQLERLATLRDSGALSDQEFEREKARILGQ
jgi:hypothetical protein